VPWIRYYIFMQEGPGQPSQRSARTQQDQCASLINAAHKALASMNVGEALKLAEQAVDAADSSILVGNTRRDVRVSTRQNAAVLCTLAGSFAEALSYIESAISIFSADTDQPHPTLFELHQHCSTLLLTLGREAEAGSRWSGPIAHIAETSDNPLLALDIRLQHAAFLTTIGLKQEAGIKMVEAFNGLRLIDGERAGETALILERNAQTFAKEGQFLNAALLVAAAVEKYQNVLSGVESRQPSDVLDGLRAAQIDYLFKAGRLSNARNVYQPLLADWEKRRKPADPFLISLREALAELEAESGNFRTALELAHKNLQITSQYGNEASQKLAKSKIAKLHVMQGHYRNAKEILGIERSASQAPANESLSGNPGYYVPNTISLDAELQVADGLQPLLRIYTRYEIFRRHAQDSVNINPERALELIGHAEDEIAPLAPGLTTGMAKALGDLRATAIANLGGLAAQIELKEREIEASLQRDGASKAMSYHASIRDLAELYIKHEKYEKAEELLRQVKNFLELRNANDILLYGTTLLSLATITADDEERAYLRAQGESIVESLRHQTGF
jgi:hypothetical protein